MAQAILNQIDFAILRSQSKMEVELSQETKDLATLLKTFTEENENQQYQNSSQDNNANSNKKRLAYSSTKVKARTLLTNVAYRRYKSTDFNKTSFIVDILSFLVHNCNPTNLEIKLETEKEREMVKFLWDRCIPHDFVAYLLKQENFNVISQTNLTYQKGNSIVTNYIKNNVSEKLSQLKFKINKRFNLIHYIYSSLYAKMYNRTNHFGIKRKNDFDFQFQLWRKEKQQKFLGKEPANYVSRKFEKDEQAPIKETNVKQSNRAQKKRML